MTTDPFWATARRDLSGAGSPMSRRRRRGSAIGSVTLLVVGLLLSWVIGSNLHSADPYPDGQTLHGTVVALDHSSRLTKRGKVTACTVEVEFVFRGATARARAGHASGEECALMGQPLDVSVRASDPRTARVLISGDRPTLVVAEYFAWLILAVGAWRCLVLLAYAITGGAGAPKRRRLPTTGSEVRVVALTEDPRDG
ncbi:hypothetical protein [Terrabacter sp. NPDC080008]|uniref:hypothetical protein n=1 Tax=Terrabacter sp. NPDC080008 TaxID=3155176 RepID=UPI00344F4878